MRKPVNLKNVCVFAQCEEQYQEYLDGNLDRDSLVTICQNVLDSGREDLKEYPEFPGYAKWLGI